MTELVSRLGRTRQQRSELISDLEDDGLVNRVQRRVENRRLVYVSLDCCRKGSCMHGPVKI